MWASQSGFSHRSQYGLYQVTISLPRVLQRGWCQAGYLQSWYRHCRPKRDSYASCAMMLEAPVLYASSSSTCGSSPRGRLSIDSNGLEVEAQTAPGPPPPATTGSSVAPNCPGRRDSQVHAAQSAARRCAQPDGAYSALPSARGHHRAWTQRPSLLLHGRWLLPAVQAQGRAPGPQLTRPGQNPKALPDP